MRIPIGLPLAAIVMSSALGQATAHASDAQAKETGTPGGAVVSAHDAQTEASRKAYEGFLSLLAKGDVRAAAEQYAAEDYVQHMPGVASGREGAIAHIQEEIARGGKATVVGFVADGNWVGAHIRHTFTDGTPSRDVIEIWRVENGKFAEHWGVAQVDTKQDGAGREKR